MTILPAYLDVTPASSVIFADAESETTAVVTAGPFVLGKIQGTQVGTYRSSCGRSRHKEMCHLIVPNYIRDCYTFDTH